MKRYLLLSLCGILALLIAAPAFAGKGQMQRKRDRARSCQAVQGAAAQATPVAGKGTTERKRDRVRQCAGQAACPNFVDEDGDGVCDNCPQCRNPDAPDDDGDGIPNGQDDDYTPPQDGSGRQHRGGR